MKTPFLFNVYRMLLGLILILGLIFLGGTVYGFFIRKDNEAAATPGRRVVPGVSGEHVFTGIGRLRLNTAARSGLESAMVILSITFPYSPEDLAFSEELSARVRDFRTISRDYFQSMSSRELRNKSEEQIKTELLENFNRVLRLGKIELLYFNDFMIMD